MKTNKLNIKNTLNKKQQLDKTTKDLSEITSELKSIHPNNVENIVRTTIHLPEDIHTEIKVICAKKGISLKDYVTEVLIKSVSDHKNTKT